MLRRRGRAVLLALVVAAGLAGAVSSAAEGDAASPQPSAATPTTAVPSCPSGDAPAVADPAQGQPARLVIPAIDVDATVIPLVSEGDDLEPPADVTKVGWWAAGAEPGSAKGAAVFVGHTVHAGGGVFDDLADVEVGDAIRVRTGVGWVRYRVSEVRKYSRKEIDKNAERLFGQSGPGRLVLVTCSGYRLGTYHGNTVVTASPVASKDH